MKYRKKPVVIDAIQWTNDYEEVEKLCSLAEFIPTYLYSVERIDDELVVKIRTLEGEMIAGPGDYIIRGIKGEYYPCKPDIFEQTYELCEEE